MANSKPEGLATSLDQETVAPNPNCDVEAKTVLEHLRDVPDFSSNRRPRTTMSGFDSDQSPQLSPKEIFQPSSFLLSTSNEINRETKGQDASREAILRKRKLALQRRQARQDRQASREKLLELVAISRRSCNPEDLIVFSNLNMSIVEIAQKVNGLNLNKIPFKAIKGIMIKTAASLDENVGKISEVKINRLLGCHSRYLSSWKYRNKKLFKDIVDAVHIQYEKEPFPVEIQDLIVKVRKQPLEAMLENYAKHVPLDVVKGVILMIDVRAGQEEISLAKTSLLLGRSLNYLANWKNEHSELFEKIYQTILCDYQNDSLPQEAKQILEEIKYQIWATTNNHLEENGWGETSTEIKRLIKLAPFDIIKAAMLLVASEIDEEIVDLQAFEVSRVLKKSQRYVANWKYANKELFEELCQTIRMDYADRSFPDEIQMLLDEAKQTPLEYLNRSRLQLPPEKIVEAIELLVASELDDEIEPLSKREISSLMGRNINYLSQFKCKNKETYDRVYAETKARYKREKPSKKVQSLLNEIQTERNRLLGSDVYCLDYSNIAPIDIVKIVTLMVAVDMEQGVGGVGQSNVCRSLGYNPRRLTSWKFANKESYQKIDQVIRQDFKDKPFPSDILALVEAFRTDG